MDIVPFASKWKLESAMEEYFSIRAQTKRFLKRIAMMGAVSGVFILLLGLMALVAMMAH